MKLWGNEKKKHLKEKLKSIHERRMAVRRYGEDIIQSRNFLKTRGHIQHGSVTVYEHSLNVASCSLLIARKLGISCNQRELVRGALLHDYFLYDWHEKIKSADHRTLHGFFHPGVALKNAGMEYTLTPREADIIKKHMWPMTVVPPLCREAWIVSMADKYCSFMETVHLHEGEEQGRQAS